MSKSKPKTAATQSPAAKSLPAQAAPVRRDPPPLFRKIDWLTLLLTFGAVWIGYYLTLAPELTLEDSGELATGSYYAGIPHPPGYPFWTIYTWLWTTLVPFGNVAWRVALGEATGGALAAGLLGLLVSRGSSLLMEGIEGLKRMGGAWESAICMVSGYVAGMLIGFNGFMWSQSVIVEVYSFSVASFMVVLLCLLRWIYAPQQRRYLFYALFFHGLCFTNHQTLIVAAIGIEVAIAAADFRMGRNLFLGNAVVFCCGLLLVKNHVLTGLEQNPGVFGIFKLVGWASLAAYVVFLVLTWNGPLELGRDVCQAVAFISLASIPGAAAGRGTGPWLFLALAALAAFGWLAWRTRRFGGEWLVVLVCGVAWLAGAAFYFYMPVAGMSNPPMEWGYPRTVEGFIHAFSRGQYGATNPTDVFGQPAVFVTQLVNMGRGIVDEFNWVYVLLALAPFALFLKMKQRERAWIIGITAIYLCLGVLLLVLLNPPPDRAAQELNRVFFTASHTLIALLMGYGLTIIAAFMATDYQRFRVWGIAGGTVALVLAVGSFFGLTSKTYFGPEASPGVGEILGMAVRAFTYRDQYGLPVFAGVLLVAMTLIFLVALVVYRSRAPLAISLAVFALMPVYSILTHWSDNEQRDHWFGYWYGHDMFTPPFKGKDGKPLYPEMAKDAILFGGTDPGRFCPTYMIFCDSFTPHDCLPREDQKFDRRDVYIITQNALADPTYLCYLRAQYNRSAQIDPPFFQELLRPEAERTRDESTNFFARAFVPVDRLFTEIGSDIEKRRRTYTSWFTERDLFNVPALAERLRPGAKQDAVSKYLYDNLRPETQQLVGGNDTNRLKAALVRDFNGLLEREFAAADHLRTLLVRKAEVAQQAAQPGAPASLRDEETALLKEIAAASDIRPLYVPERFEGVAIPDYLAEFIRQKPMGYSLVRLNRLLLEAAYPDAIATSIGGLYPDREIYIPTVDDMQRCYSDYSVDVAQRMREHRLRPGEDVVDENGRLQLRGQIAVMAVNGLVAKVVFDRNPKNEFYVEESLPLQWMYPHLTPFGIIMKVNRQPVPAFTEEMLDRDHAFWTQYSERLIGNWINYDTSVKDIVAFVEKVYLRRNFSGFKGDRKFIRDDQAQKSFSKLRSAVAGIYMWRLGPECPPELRPKTDAEFQRLLKEADFAYRQSVAFCPYSPEGIFNYVNLLVRQQRLDDAVMLVATWQKLDPFNGQVNQVLRDLRGMQQHPVTADPVSQALARQEKAVASNPADFQAALNLASAYLNAQRTNDAARVLNAMLQNPAADVRVFRTLVEAYASFGDTNGLRLVAEKLRSKFAADSGDFAAGFGYAQAALRLQQRGEATAVLDQIVNNPRADAGTLLEAVQVLAQTGDYARVEVVLRRLTQVAPEMPEGWYDLAGIESPLGKRAEAISALRQAILLSDRRHAADPGAKDLKAIAKDDPRFAPVRGTAEFQELFKP
jgi:tetratricopeptide (TPR) repeat protein